MPQAAEEKEFNLLVHQTTEKGKQASLFRFNFFSGEMTALLSICIKTAGSLTQTACRPLDGSPVPLHQNFSAKQDANPFLHSAKTAKAKQNVFCTQNGLIGLIKK